MTYCSTYNIIWVKGIKINKENIPEEESWEINRWNKIINQLTIIFFTDYCISPAREGVLNMISYYTWSVFVNFVRWSWHIHVFRATPVTLIQAKVAHLSVELIVANVTLDKVFRSPTYRTQCVFPFIYCMQINKKKRVCDNHFRNYFSSNNVVIILILMYCYLIRKILQFINILSSIPQVFEKKNIFFKLYIVYRFNSFSFLLYWKQHGFLILYSVAGYFWGYFDIKKSI